MEFIYLVFTRMPGGVTVGDSGLCCCVPCLLNAMNSLRLMIHLGQKKERKKEKNKSI